MTPAAPLEPHPDRLLPPDPGVRAIARRQVAVITDSLDRIARVTSVRALGLATIYADVHRSPTTDVRNR
jgi:hypothetical protein